MLEPMLDPEPLAKRRAQQTRTRGRADQRERRKLQRHHTGAGPLADRDRQASVLHRRIERLLQSSRKPVDLVDEEHRPLVERGQERRHVALSLQRRAGCLDELHVQLGRDDLCQRGLAESGRSGEQHMVERLAPAGSRGD